MIDILKDFRVSAIDANIIDEGNSVLLSMITDQGPMAAVMDRSLLERLVVQASAKLQAVPRPSQRRSDA